MRLIHRWHPVFALVPALVAGVLASACSGDEATTDNTGLDAGGSDATVRPDTGATTGGTTSTADAGPDGTADGGRDSGPARTFDAGPAVTLDGGGIDGGVPCVSGGTLETEPNDTEGTAETLANTPGAAGSVQVASKCGVVGESAGDADGGDAGAPDVDYYKFRFPSVVPDGGVPLQYFHLQYFGNITFTVVVNGQTFTFGQGSDPDLLYFADKDYVVKVQTKGTGATTYRLSLFEEF